MGYGFRHVKRQVHFKVKEYIVKDMIKYISEHDLKLQGLEKGRKSFDQEYVYCCLYKYIANIGYNKLWDDISTLMNGHTGFIPESAKTLRTNIQKVRKALKFWASKYIYVRSEELVESARASAGLKSHVHKCDMLIDSQDVRICKERNNPPPRLDDYWSGKIENRAQRFMIISDFGNWIHYISYGYIPKVHDDHWVSSHKDLFDLNFNGNVFLADLHFKNMEKYTNGGTHVLTRIEKSKSGGKLTPSEETFNIAVSQGRARCEQVFTRIQFKFESLQKPWEEELEAQEDIMHIGAAITNMEILNK